MGSSDEGSSSETMRVVLQREPTSLNPTFSPLSDSRAWGGIFDSLVGLDRQSLQPTEDGLLTSWEQTTPTEWTFEVRDGVKFHNGEDFDAEAAVFTIEELRDNPASILRTYYDIVEKAEAVDGDLKITTVSPYAALPVLLTNAFVVAPEYYAEVGPEEFAQKPVGTGPYELATYRSGQSLSVVAFDEHWRGEPKLEGIDYSWSSEASSRYALLASGDVDFAIDMQPQDVKRIEASDDLEVASGPTTYGMTIIINALKGPTADARVREAIAKAIDREGLVSAVFDGTGAVASRAFIGDLLADPVDVEVDQDVDAASALVEQAGKNKITFGYTSGMFPGDTVTGGAISGMLKEAGFDVNQRAEEYGAYRDLRNKGAFDIFMQEISPTFAHPDTFTGYFLGASGALNYCVDGKGYDELNAKGLAADEDEAQEVYATLEQKVIAEDYCFVPLTKTVYSYGMSDRVTGFEAPRNAAPDYWALGLK